LKKELLVKLRQGYHDNNPQGIQLQQFLHPQYYQQLLSEIQKAKLSPIELRDKFNYFGAKSAALNFFSKPQFLSFASAITSQVLTHCEVSVRLFMHRNYTLMHDDVDTSKVEFYLDCTPEWNEKNGGAITLLSSEGEALRIPTSANTLILGQSGRSYVKYVNNNAGNDGRLLIYGLLSTSE